MAQNLSNYVENKILDHLFRVAGYTMPGALGIALSTANPTDDNSGLAEPALADGYARASASSGVFTVAASAGQIANSVAITFPAATGSGWGTLTHAAICDSTSRASGNLLWHGPLNTAKTVTVGDVVSFPIGSIVASLN